MSESVSEILQNRATAEPGFSKSVSGSVVVHVLGVVALFLSHQYLLTHKPPQPKVMTISLGGGVGPRSTGMSAAGARAVDVAAPQPKHEVIKTASSQSNVMTLPIKSEPKPTPQVDKALPISSMPKPPTVGAQVRPGTSQAETGSTSQSTGLTIGGGGGSSMGLEITDFCCPDYLQGVLQRINDKWNKNVPERGEATLRFVIHRDGSVTDITTDKTTSTFLENQSRSALVLARLLPLPAEFNNDHLVIHLRFPYGIQ